MSNCTTTNIPFNSLVLGQNAAAAFESTMDANSSAVRALLARMRRYTRLSNGFSRNLRNYAAATALTQIY